MADTPVTKPRNSSAKSKKSKRNGKKKRRRSPFMRLMRALGLIASIVVAIGLFATAYAGHVSPLRHGGLWGILPLCLPMAIIAGACLMVLQVWWHWRGVIILAVSFVASAQPVLQVCPLHLPWIHPKAPEGAETFTLLSYNVHNFVPSPESADTVANPMIEYILTTDADVVCLQEAPPLSVYAPLGITSAQVQQLHNRYPYIIQSASNQMVLSRFPLTPIHLSLTKEEFDDATLAVYRLTMPSGHSATLFNVHLQSLRLYADDRELYRDITRLRVENVESVRSQLIDKLSYANVERARQTQALLRLIRHYGGPDVLIAGDFNDVATCYAMRTLADAGFSEVYPKLGFGPIVTYNSGRFYFGIDHIMYRGAFKPLRFAKGTLRASDHYPVFVEMSIGRYTSVTNGVS